MKKIFIYFLFIIVSNSAFPQTIDAVNKVYEVCVYQKTHKGKLNHGKPYCTAWAIINEYKDGHKDTMAWFSGGNSFEIGEYEKYQKLSDRGKDIIDSLKEDGIMRLDMSFLVYEPIYMETGEKIQSLWEIENKIIVLYDYLFWKNKNGRGFKLLKKIEIK